MRWYCSSRSESRNLFLEMSSNFCPFSYCSFEQEVYSEWIQSVDEVAASNLEKPLLERNQDTHLISVNFDPKVEKRGSDSSMVFIKSSSISIADCSPA